MLRQPFAREQHRGCDVNLVQVFDKGERPTAAHVCAKVKPHRAGIDDCAAALGNTPAALAFFLKRSERVFGYLNCKRVEPGLVGGQREGRKLDGDPFKAFLQMESAMAG